MSLNSRTLSLQGLEIIRPTLHKDERGHFSEIWKPSWFSEFKQMNLSVSKLCTFRGLHYQWDRPQGKLIRINRGKALFFELDVRSYSPTFGKYETIEMNSTDNEWLWVPAGFANGFFTLEDDTEIIYMCTEEWSKNEGCINHSVLSFPFRLLGDIRHVSDKDKNAPTFEESVYHLENISEFFRDNDKSIV
jgi:dTDP-4-dehydrorhamnose 3,5-epimerase